MPVRSEEEQAELLARTVLSAKATDAKVLSIYSWADRGNSILEREDNFGLRDTRGQAKPAYSAVTKTIALVKGMKRLDVRRSARSTLLIVGNKNEKLYIAWAATRGQAFSIERQEAQRCEQIDILRPGHYVDCMKALRDGTLAIAAGQRPMAVRLVAGER